MKEALRNATAMPISVDDADCVCDILNGISNVKMLLRSVALGLDVETKDVNEAGLRLEVAKNALDAMDYILEQQCEQLSKFYNAVLLPYVTGHSRRAGVSKNADELLEKLGRDLEIAAAEQNALDQQETRALEFIAAIERAQGIAKTIAATPANGIRGLIIKARALRYLHNGVMTDEPFDGDLGETTDVRLAWDIARGVLALATDKREAQLLSKNVSRVAI